MGTDTLADVYTAWLCDGDAYLTELASTRGWWTVRRDIDAEITPDGRLLIDGEEA